eukprot:CAMPEP_0113870896 /NCGR_PEP_ID=MMETSP0780_2-20120614/2339_1 /TAXON_ID=652834 /ORGANISM="Palpitomonas bilix" /LENGTH=662 /DNA_ID=CAMNT_0000856221 /DNA_START=174 /DNA_END=2162 /DNA_ORIENTATION=- /assembly_acc=CAM_ASM_000599
MDGDNLKCNICLQLFSTASSLPCGHCFCKSCIVPFVEEKRQCPVCHKSVTLDKINPNVPLDAMVEQYKKTVESSSAVAQLGNLEDAEELQRAIVYLEQKKAKAAARVDDAGYELLWTVLKRMREERAQELARLIREVDALDNDLNALHPIVASFESSTEESRKVYVYQRAERTMSVKEDLEKRYFEEVCNIRERRSESGHGFGPGEGSEREERRGDGQAASVSERDRQEEIFSANMDVWRQRIATSTSGWDERLPPAGGRGGSASARDSISPPNGRSRRPSLSVVEIKQKFNPFVEDLSALSRFSCFESRGSFELKAENFLDGPFSVPSLDGGYPPSGSQSDTESMATSLVFNSSQDLFASVGTFRSLKVFRFSSFEDAGQGSPTVLEMPFQLGLSCVGFSHFSNELLVVGDHDGMLQLFDVSGGKFVSRGRWSGHERRVWTIAYSPVQASVFATGSDDGSVKLWSARQKGSSVSVFGAPEASNVCTLAFHPTNSNLFAFGCADRCVYEADLRKPGHTVVNHFTGHHKAVANVRYIDPHHIVSASTDSTLKMWNTDTGELERTYTGHLNERSFVGMETFDSYILTGSESNAAFLYHQSSQRPLLWHHLDDNEEWDDMFENPDDPPRYRAEHFISAVAVRKKTNHCIVANSAGAIRCYSLKQD